jgi:hypothetical protein
MAAKKFLQRAFDSDANKKEVEVKITEIDSSLTPTMTAEGKKCK